MTFTKHRFKAFSIVTLLTLVFASCEDKDTGSPYGDTHFFIFGHFYGECGGEGCIEMYKLENGRLYEDDLDNYPNFTTPITAHWNELPQAKYELVKDLEDDIPNELYSVQEHVLGQPDAGDWGGIYVQVLFEGDIGYRSGFWLLDKNENNMDSVFNVFVDRIEEKIALIQ
jgi:hypothetical protein